MDAVLCVDFGSTFTKALLVTDGGGRVTTAETPTARDSDLLDGHRRLVAALDVPPDTPTLACSSAGGGLRLAVVGYERQVTAEAGHRVGLSAGARVVHVADGLLDTQAVRALERTSPDLVLLVGGTDGGNAEVVRHNASRLAVSRLDVPVVVAGNVDARDEVAERLRAGGCHVVTADNVVPQIGVIAPTGARSAIRAAFLEHVIGGKGLSTDPAFALMVRAPTPDAVLRGVEVAADVLGADVLAVDVGGATTDVYSVVTPEGEDATLRKEVVAPLWHARTVEGDLGMRWNAAGIVEAAAREGLAVHPQLPRYATSLAAEPGHLPAGAQEQVLDLRLAEVAAVVAVRRHGRPTAPGEAPRPLAGVELVLGSGGVLRHASPSAAAGVLGSVVADHAGGWSTPRAARAVVDHAYLLFAVGLLAEEAPEVAVRLARRLLEPVE